MPKYEAMIDGRDANGKHCVQYREIEAAGIRAAYRVAAEALPAGSYVRGVVPLERDGSDDS